IPTPGRNGNYIDSENEDSASDKSKTDSNAVNDLQAVNIISLLGEKDNIEDIDACMTRLRVTVKDINLVAEEKEWKKDGALGLILRDNGVQAIYGPKADVLKSNIQDILGV
ncbi:glucose PTS transporter subunit EIIB, partial [Clostridium perfringens]